MLYTYVIGALLDTARHDGRRCVVFCPAHRSHGHHDTPRQPACHARPSTISLFRHPQHPFCPELKFGPCSGLEIDFHAIRAWHRLRRGSRLPGLQQWPEPFQDIRIVPRIRPLVVVDHVREAQLPAPEEEQNIVQVVAAVDRRAIAAHQVAVGWTETSHGHPPRARNVWRVLLALKRKPLLAAQAKAREHARKTGATTRENFPTY